MNCDQAINLLAQRVDARVSAPAMPDLDEHLATCAGCRAMADALAAQETLLERGFERRRLAAVAVGERAMAQVRAQSALSPRRQAVVWRISKALFAAAAGFAVAVMVFRPWEHGGAPGPGPVAVVQPVGQLSLATGAVYVCPGGSEQWRALESGGAVGAGMRVKTAPSVRCELKMTDGSEVRLNDQTEVKVAGARRIEVASGQVYSSVAKREEAFVVQAGAAGATLTALGTGFDVRCSSQEAVLTVAEGSVRVNGAGGEAIVRKGEMLTISAGQLADKRTVQSLMQATAWVDEILVMKGRDNPELSRRVDDIFAQLGQSKMWYMQAQEVRRLGDHCVVPLSRYIQSERSKNSDQQHKRRQAADIIADVATSSSIPELINLLNDPDGEIRYSAARALRRLTGEDQGFSAEQWRDVAYMGCVPSIVRWHGWWEKNKTMFPGADPAGVKSVEVMKEKKG